VSDIHKDYKRLVNDGVPFLSEPVKTEAPSEAFAP
jgi:hypothetical protein